MADEESEKIIKMYEEMFSKRYTEDDAEYQKAVSTPTPNPPCVKGYFTRPKRNFDGNRGGRGGGHWGNRGGGRDWNRNRDQHGGGGGRGYDRRGYQHQGGQHSRDYDRHSNRGDRHSNRGGNQDHSNRDNRYQPY